MSTAPYITMTTPFALPYTPLLVASPLGPLRVSGVDARPSEARERMEAFVQRGYRTHFGAEISSFLPRLLGASDASGELRAVIGVRPGGAEPLFLEQYLDVPIEVALSNAARYGIEREQVLEVGNLVTRPSSVAWPFMQAFLLWSLATTRCDWLVFTGTRAVRALLSRMGSEMLELSVARPERLGEAADDWGAYYRHQPRVVAASAGELLPLLDPALFDPDQMKSYIDRGLELRR